MHTNPTHQQLAEALEQAGNVHHDYESNYLDGVRDEMWAGFYAAYVLGRVGDFTTPTLLTRWLKEVTAEENWTGEAAGYVLAEAELYGA